jgi:hypothetical protein
MATPGARTPAAICATIVMDCALWPGQSHTLNQAALGG